MPSHIIRITTENCNKKCYSNLATQLYLLFYYSLPSTSGGEGVLEQTKTKTKTLH